MSKFPSFKMYSDVYDLIKEAKIPAATANDFFVFYESTGDYQQDKKNGFPKLNHYKNVINQLMVED